MNRSYSYSFSLDHRSQNGQARAGTIRTARSTIQTPAFMPVATHGVFRGQATGTVAEIGYQVILANTYHLLLRPGREVFRQLGKIHDFMKWPSSVLTDSGGFQIFSLARHASIDDQGATFRSYVDGKKVFLSPEISIQTQADIGSDIMMVLDQCIPALSDKITTEQAMRRTHAWAQRSFTTRNEITTQALFGIVQGACFLDLRKESADYITNIPFDGYAIGGLAVGEDRERRKEIVEYTAKLLPENKSRYLMGVGTPLDLLEGVFRGIDMFDCILPTMMAQQGTAFTWEGKLQLKRTAYRFSDEPLENSCDCFVCKTYTRAYLHHLMKAETVNAGTLLGIHNLAFYKKLTEEMRSHILNDSFETFYQEKRQTLGITDGDATQIRPPRESRFPKMVGDYELIVRNEYAGIRHRSSTEVMHSVNDPYVEAEQIYVQQSGLRKYVSSETAPLVIWDIGLGAATNAMTALLAYEKVAKATAPMRIVSFENDLDALRLALHYASLFPHVRHAAPKQILETGVWSSKVHDLQWKLIYGNIQETLSQAETPDVIFYDPFSFKTNQELWTLSWFTRLYEFCKDGTVLFTYSASTSIRSALLAAGFLVARGRASGPKEETTIAIRGPTGLKKYDLLGSEWLARWERSHQKFPSDLQESGHEMFAKKIREHSQFVLAL